MFTQEGAPWGSPCWTCRLQWVGGYTGPSHCVKNPLPRVQDEKWTGTPRLKGGPWREGLHGPWRAPRSPISLLHSKPGLRCGNRRPARGRQAQAPACSWPRPAAWARAVTRKRSGSGSGVSAGRMAADTQVRRAAAGPTRPADGCGRRPRGRTACAASQGVCGAPAAESAAPGPSRAASSRLRLRVRPGPPSRAALTDRRARGRGSDLGIGSWSRAGPFPALSRSSPFRDCALFLRSPPAVSQRQLFLKLSVQRMFLEHLLRAGTYSIGFGFIPIGV